MTMSLNNLRAELAKDLLPSEKIVWEGQPNPSKLFTLSDVFLIPFSVLWFGFALFWEATALFMIPKDEPVGIIFPLFGLPFVIVGFYFAIGRFIYKRKKKEHTYYALTNKRAIIYTDFLGKNIQAVFLRDISAINKSINKNGFGTITFGNNNLMTGMYSNTGLDFFNAYYGGNVPAFYDVMDADTVYRKVNELRAS